MSDEIQQNNGICHNIRLKEKCEPNIHVINLIADPIIRGKLRSLYNRCFEADNPTGKIAGIIEQIRTQSIMMDDNEKQEMIHALEKATDKLKKEK